MYPILAFTTGFGLSLGLIIAIGPQNAFVLHQGFHRSHVFTVCLTCALCDAAFIILGVMGVGALLQRLTWLEQPLMLAAILFIVGFGISRLFAAYNGGKSLETQAEHLTLHQSILATLGFTFLNPHVYLDTLVLLGGASTQFSGLALLFFTTGAIIASVIFFFTLGYGASKVSPWLQSPQAWQRIDFAIGAMMLAFGAVLLLPMLG